MFQQNHIIQEILTLHFAIKQVETVLKINYISKSMVGDNLSIIEMMFW